MGLYVFDTDMLTLFEMKHPAVVARVREQDRRDRPVSPDPKRHRGVDNEALQSWDCARVRNAPARVVRAALAGHALIG
jgi:hypothetical protein